MKHKFEGVYTALVTPFYHGEVDFKSLENMVKHQLKAGISGLVINGTTAESPNLSKDEIEKIFNRVKSIVGSQMPLILGTGSNSTAHAVEMTQWAEKLGADAALVVVPYYNKPSQKGLELHYKKIASETQLPIILYNVPGRTITSLSEETILSLAQVKNIVGIKEASGDLVFDKNLKSKLPEDFIFLSGDDGSFIDFMNIGGHGVISVMSNIIPEKSMEWFLTLKEGSLKAPVSNATTISSDIFNKVKTDFSIYEKFIASMYVEANPIPVKWMMFENNLIQSAEMRLPLTDLDSKYYEQLTNEMKKIGLL